ncbi:TIGR00730 family Rossman fold protein [Nitratiruptor sp. SB155-2]|uniref:LOG family protein n=1 Tax=Nitratiruptor sp. (strain SB155-2) TaxID=387092 RepID=UPI0001587176|nr:TIGR00730 family Rossman fold protein [Nitratiruptor sp. SB155-2]BAF70039.1 decarboxylase family protein [Nitratiruptor sp. SB155-2]
MKKRSFPWQKPKPKTEEPKVEELLQKIFDSPSYKLAMEDVGFLMSDDTRGVRLELDYLKPELIMKKYGIKHTIVVFGSARIKEPKTALNELNKIQKLVNKEPNSKQLLRELRIAEKMVEKSIYYEEARNFGQLVGEAGKGPEDNTLTLMTGGGPGIMEAANRGAYNVGAKSIGLNIQLPHEQFPNPYVSPELCFQFHYFAIRKLHFLHRACALVVFPGGFGTLDELFETLTLIQTHKNRPIPVVLVGKEYWHKLINFKFLVDEGTIEPEDLHIFTFKENAQEAWEYILGWYEKRGLDLFDNIKDKS